MTPGANGSVLARWAESMRARSSRAAADTLSCSSNGVEMIPCSTAGRLGWRRGGSGAAGTTPPSPLVNRLTMRLKLNIAGICIGSLFVDMFWMFFFSRSVGKKENFTRKHNLSTGTSFINPGNSNTDCTLNSALILLWLFIYSRAYEKKKNVALRPAFLLHPGASLLITHQRKSCERIKQTISSGKCGKSLGTSFCATVRDAESRPIRSKQNSMVRTAVRNLIG